MTMATRPVVHQLVLRRQSLVVPSTRHLAAKAYLPTCVVQARTVSRTATAAPRACRRLTSSIDWAPKAAIRAYSARAADQGGSVNHAFVRCRSSGSMIVSMYNVFEHPPTTPLLLYLPPSPQPHIKETETFEGDSEAKPESFTDDLAPPPDYLLRLNMPIVSIRYRWSAAALDGADADAAREAARTKVPPPSFLWPTPLHDVIFAYDWIKENLSPPPVEAIKSGQPWRGSSANKLIVQSRRDLYVYGTHLGASLATSLALTESHLNQHMAIRGLATYNGIYNWTAFVQMAADGIPVADDAAAVNSITPGIPSLSSLFGTPADLFDDFVSPCLIFRTPGLVVAPVDFDKDINRTRIEEAELQFEQMEDRAALDPEGASPPRQTSILLMGMSQQSYLAFPPMKSALIIPPSLLMHTQTDGDAKPAASRKVTGKRYRVTEAVHGKNSYAMQADEMASLMRRGIIAYEMKRKLADEQTMLSEYETVENEADADSRIAESEHRVRQVGLDVAPTDDTLEPGEEGQQILAGWLNEHMEKAAGYSQL